MHTKTRQLIKSVSSKIHTKGLESEYQYVPLAVIGVVSFILYYFVWRTVLPGEYENIYLRIAGAVLCFFLLIKDYWPNSLRGLLPYYWYFTLIFCFPYFFTFMMFKNPHSYVWLVVTTTGLFYLLLLVDLISTMILVFIGTGLAWITYILTTNVIQTPELMLKTWPSYLTVIVAGGLFIHRSETIKKEKFDSIRNIGEIIAHELRTPLAKIMNTTKTISSILPKLVEAYYAAKEANLKVKLITRDQLDILNETNVYITEQVEYSNSVINTILRNASTPGRELLALEVCSILKCLNSALERAHFYNDQSKDIFNITNSHDFQFMGQEIIIVHVFINLINNALYFIAKAQKGSITISTSKETEFNVVYFRDTGYGMSKDVLNKVFLLFFTTETNGYSAPT